MLPPKDQPSAPKNAKNTARRCQSVRPDSNAAARLASMPGTIAPYSCPKLPRIPHPMESESPTHSTANSPGLTDVLAQVASAPTDTGSSPIAKLMSATLMENGRVLHVPLRPRDGMILTSLRYVSDAPFEN